MDEFLKASQNATMFCHIVHENRKHYVIAITMKEVGEQTTSLLTDLLKSVTSMGICKLPENANVSFLAIDGFVDCSDYNFDACVKNYKMKQWFVKPDFMNFCKTRLLKNDDEEAALRIGNHFSLGMAIYILETSDD